MQAVLKQQKSGI